MYCSKRLHKIKGVKSIDIQESLRKHIRRYDDMLTRLPEQFTPEAVHNARVEFKKLRALLRLLIYDADSKYRIAPALVRCYHALGPVRNLQLFIPHWQSLFPETSFYLESKIKSLQQAQQDWIKMEEKGQWQKGLIELEQEVPSRLTITGYQKFLQLKLTAIRIYLLSDPEETELHSIRKIVKDCFYVMRLNSQEWKMPAVIPPDLSLKSLPLLADELGLFNDACTMLNLLNADWHQSWNQEDREKMTRLQQLLLTEKKARMQDLLQQLPVLFLHSLPRISA